MPAKRRKRKNNLSKRKGRGPLVYFIFVVIVVLVGVIVLNSTRYWNVGTKLSVLVQESKGDVNIITFDPFAGEITKIIIPSNTEVEVARGFGVFGLGNVWQLGFSEGLNGDLLAKTVAKNFKFPVYIWAENKAVGFASTNYVDIAHAVFSNYRTNLRIGDRIRIALFALRIPNSRRIEINLSETQYLKKTELVDGEEGYVVVKNIPVSILSVFAEPHIIDGEFKAVIINNSANSEVAKQVGKIIEVLGAKVVSVKKGESDVMGCVVRGANELTILQVSRIFGCGKEVQEKTTHFDIEVVLGSDIEENF